MIKSRPAIVLVAVLAAWCALAKGATRARTFHRPAVHWLGSTPQSGLSEGEIVVAELPSGEAEEQVPAKEQLEPRDSPDADQLPSGVEAQVPAVEVPPKTVEQPPADRPPRVVQPALER